MLSDRRSEFESDGVPVSRVQARLFKLSAFGWEGRDAVGFFRSSWGVESEGARGKHAYLAFKAANGVPNHNDLDGYSFWGLDFDHFLHISRRYAAPHTSLAVFVPVPVSGVALFVAC